MKAFKEILVTLLVTFLLVIGLGLTYSWRASAEPVAGTGCETVGWGLNIFGNWTQRRVICDGPKLSDGSWNRARVIYTPAGYVRGYCSTYSCYSGYYREETMQAKEVYPVTDSTVLENEPAWLPPGTDRLSVR